jgi:hypothetical protein
VPAMEANRLPTVARFPKETDSARHVNRSQSCTPIYSLLRDTSQSGQAADVPHSSALPVA